MTVEILPLPTVNSGSRFCDRNEINLQNKGFTNTKKTETKRNKLIFAVTESCYDCNAGFVISL